MKQIIGIILIVVMFLTACSNKKTTDSKQKTNLSMTQNELFLLVGTYTSDDGSKGIYLYKFNEETGESDLISISETKNPSYLTLSSDERFVYSVDESGEKKSRINAFLFDKENGILDFLNSQNAEGADPCYIEIDKADSYVFSANYSSGSISIFPVQDKGKLAPAELVLNFTGSGIDSVRQRSPHLHSVRFSPDGKYLFASDLGSDKIYRYDAIGSVFKGQPAISRNSIKEFSTPSGNGPRHFDFHPNGKYMYLLGELSGEVVVYDYDNGDLIEKQTIASDTTGARGSADIHVSPDGKFLYTSNRLQADGIAIFLINEADGTLSKVGYQLTGKHPRNFTITPNGKLLLAACRDDNTIQVFSIDNQSGLLTDLNLDIAIDKPVCLKFATP